MISSNSIVETISSSCISSSSSSILSRFLENHTNYYNNTIPAITSSSSSINSTTLYHAFQHALYAGLVLSISHVLCVAIVMYYDLSGKWKQYSLNPNRSVTWYDYYVGIKSFLIDLTVLFVPFMTICFYYRYDEIYNCNDPIGYSILKLICGYTIGKLWAFVIHYVLHVPYFYKFHKRHHRNPKTIVASASWEDSFVEYTIMELPSFGITVCMFPTHYLIHLIHFAIHGWDGACGHSGFKAPGILGWFFDGEYHYYHHAYLTMNYAEMEIIDYIMGTHHTQLLQPTTTTPTTKTKTTKGW